MSHRLRKCLSQFGKRFVVIGTPRCHGVGAMGTPNSKRKNADVFIDLILLSATLEYHHGQLTFASLL
jgi:hypothetical protein